MQETIIKALIDMALKARESAYAPYSLYKVGACVLTFDDVLYTGCNIENASYGATVCAERTAVFKAISEGHSKLKAIAIVGGLSDKEIDGFAYPCGVCRQVLREFSDPENMTVIVAKNLDEYEIYTLEELLPHSFGPDFRD